jgi:hypothetical protein
MYSLSHLLHREWFQPQVTIITCLYWLQLPLPTTNRLPKPFEMQQNFFGKLLNNPPTQSASFHREKRRNQRFASVNRLLHRIWNRMTLLLDSCWSLYQTETKCSLDSDSLLAVGKRVRFCKERISAGNPHFPTTCTEKAITFDGLKMMWEVLWSWMDHVDVDVSFKKSAFWCIWCNNSGRSFHKCVDACRWLACGSKHRT